ncbi:ATP-binding cassette domain-containing protein [Micromonospora palythoicola]|uniref:ATP-binding cassette domain-containing protein n=1 Tax=Micromonospora palythoicola TaxID=3120507 RepID=UPI002FCE3CAF
MPRSRTRSTSRWPTSASTDRLLVTGPNGAGKSTPIKALAGELRPDDGTVRTRGR